MNAMKEALEAMKKIVTVNFAVSLPSQYMVSWDKPKEGCPRLIAESWGEGDDVRHLSTKFQGMQWLENARVIDAGDQPLPETLYALILLSGCYWSDFHGQNCFGGSSWYVDTAYVSKEAAMKAARDSEWLRYWVIPVKKFSSPGEQRAENNLGN